MICTASPKRCVKRVASGRALLTVQETPPVGLRSEEHTSELQSLRHRVCRPLLEKKTESLITKRRRRFSIMIKSVELAEVAGPSRRSPTARTSRPTDRQGNDAASQEQRLPSRCEH